MKTAMTISVAGKDYPVYVSDTGMFRVDLDGQQGQISAPSFAELERKARKIKTKFEFPFSSVRVLTGRVKHGTVTGIHATRGNLLIRWEDGQSEQLPGWSSPGDVTRRLTDAEAAEVERLLEARNKAVRELDRYLAPLKLESLKKAAEQARDKAAEETK